MHCKYVSAIFLVFLIGIWMPALNVKSAKVDAKSAKSSTTILETHVPVPFYYQEKDYYCGPAALQMVFSYYGENISQSEIACVARSIGDPLYVTYTDELRRAGHFSNISTSMGNGLLNNITGYTLRQFGYAAFEAQGLNLTTLKDFLDQGRPLVLLMWYSTRHVSAHYRVATGYNETHVFLHDPWNKPLWGGTYGGPNIAFNDSQFLDLWSYYNNWALNVSPWIVDFSAPPYVEPGRPIQIETAITYPQPLPNALYPYPASSCNASITLPASLALAQGEDQKKTVGTGFLQAGDSSSLSWTVIANSSASGTVSVTVEGIISGSVGAHANYAAYSYSDRIGATMNFTVNLQPPTINFSNSPKIAWINETVFFDATKGYHSYTWNFGDGNVTTVADSVIDHTYLSAGNYAVTLNVTSNGSWDTITKTVTITFRTDLNRDGTVDILDITIVAKAFGSKPADANWNPVADMNGDGVVNILDVTSVAKNYGRSSNSYRVTDTLSYAPTSVA